MQMSDCLYLPFFLPTSLVLNLKSGRINIFMGGGGRVRECECVCALVVCACFVI